MRASLRRAAAAATIASAALVAGSPAPALAAWESWQTCPAAGSVTLVTANYEAEKVWLYQDGGTVYVCFHLGTDGGVLVFETGDAGSIAPSVVPDPDASDCVTQLSVQDPVDLSVQQQWTSPPLYFCFGVNGTTVGVTVTATGPGSPAVHLWLDSHTVLCQWAKGTYCYSPYEVF